MNAIRFLCLVLIVTIGVTIGACSGSPGVADPRPDDDGPGDDLRFAEAPYPASSAVLDVQFDFSTHRREAQGSDNWPMTWGDDDHQYTVWGDGGGFGGTNQDGRASLGVARVEGPAGSYTGRNVYGGKDAPHEATFGGKSNGILSVDGDLYLWVGPGSNVRAYREAQLYRSTDRAESWTAADWTFTEFALPTFVQYGRDYQGSRDGFVYAYAIHIKQPQTFDVQRPGEIVLFRAPKEDLMNRAAYTFFAGLDGLGEPRWSSDVSDRGPVFEDPKGIGPKYSASYNSGLGRYFLLTSHTQFFGGRLGIFDAPEPWGPWTTVVYEDGWSGPDVPATTFLWSFAPRWFSDGGRRFVLVFSGTGQNDSWNTVEGSLILGP